MIDVACPQCGVVYHTLEANAGKHILCTKCGHVITIVLAVTRPAPSAPAVAAPTTIASKRRYKLSVIAVAAVAVLVVAFLLLRHNDSPKGTDAAKPDDTPKWEVVDEQSPPTSTSPKTDKPPEPRPTEYNSLPTGTRIEKDTGIQGHGELTVENGTTEDAVVRLSDATTDQTVRWFFVKAKASAKMTRIPQGSYRLAYTTGLNWVESDDAFSWQPTYDEFERQFNYDESRDSEGIQFHKISVTLNAVLLGNVHTRTITREDFLRGHRHISLQEVN